MIKKLGLCLIAVSVVLLSGNYYYKYKLDQQNDNKVLEYIENTSINENVDNLIDDSTNETEISNNSPNMWKINYTAILEIPKINLKRGVVDSTDNFKSINYAISVDKHSQYPNEYGNFILYAHSGNANIAYFDKLYKLDQSDEIYVYYNGIKYKYIIDKKYDIEKNGKAKILSSDKDRYITLITCNQSKKGKQIVLIGKLMESYSY